MDVERICRTHISSTDELKAPAELVRAVQDGSVGLLDVVRALGEYITSTEDDVRRKGVALLTDVVSQTPKEKINRQSTQVLTGFFADKLEDHESVPFALQALVALSKLPTFGSGESVKTYRAVVENVKMRSHVQSTRYWVFALIDSLMAHHRVALKKMGDDFVASYIKVAEGEKDPRNLMMGFSIMRVILIEFDPYLHLEDLFDIIFCYFPITFRPPPNDPYGITSDDLKLSLRKCMAATPRFAPLAMPVFLEKLAPSLGASKRDVLQSLTACIPVYGQQAIQGYASDLWDNLKTEIFYSPDAQIEADALETFRTMIVTLYPESKENSIDLAQEIIKECQEILQEPEKSKAKPATKILSGLIFASPNVGRFALSQVLPQLFRQYHTESEIPHRGPILSVIAELLGSLVEAYSTEGTTRSHSKEKAVEMYRDELLSLLSSGMEAPTLAMKTAGLQGAVNLCHIDGFLSAEEVSFLVQKVNELLLQLDFGDLRKSALEGLVSIAKLTRKPIEEITLPLLFGKLPDTAPPLDDEVKRLEYKHILASVSVLCALPGLLELMILRTLSRLENLASFEQAPNAADVDPVTRECNAAYAYSLLHSLLLTIRRKIQNGDLDVAKHFDTIVPRLFDYFVTGAVSRAKEPIRTDVRLLSAAASIIETITQTLSKERQVSFAAGLLQAYQNGDFKALLFKAQQDVPDSIQPFSSEAAESTQNLIILFSAALIALPAEPEVLSVDVNALLNSLLEWYLSSLHHSQTQKVAVQQILASLANKRAPDIESFLARVKDEVWSSRVVNENLSTMERTDAIEAWIWIARGLLVRNHASALPMIVQVFGLFEQSGPFVERAAKSLRILADKNGERILSKDHFCTVKPLYKQKLYNTLLPALVDGGNKQSTAQLLALGSIINTIPKSMIMSELPKMLPMIMRSLSLPDPELRCNMLEVLTSILEVQDDSADEVLHAQAKSLVEKLLVIAIPEEGVPETTAAIRSRAASLRCLGIFPDVIRYDALHPVKNKVIRELGTAVDDAKRIVRREAVDTRSKWYKYGGST
ncbi:hypothetical protein NliqN6_3965 [Naganishia liquefaciens]|uniref:MMS19 nucleotide excision repair protein n=1 Tax=Naganishia liquefaciens TaxID=104408 RepID=A0A8H3YFS0_9TREE|nr:hypothetical protein NliqN6_3965 [Naganishia liquefaciens]